MAVAVAFLTSSKSGSIFRVAKHRQDYTDQGDIHGEKTDSELILRGIGPKTDGNEHAIRNSTKNENTDQNDDTLNQRQLTLSRDDDGAGN